MDMKPADLLRRWRQAQDDLVLQYNDLGLSTLANMVSSETIDVAPVFQRRDRWNTKKQAALIESFLINLPIPPIYLAEEAGGSFSVIDGRQRLTAIKMFFEDNLVLNQLDELPELNGFRYSSLPRELQSTLGMRPLRSVTLMRQTDPELKYLVFHRLNSAGDVLNSQEIRNVIYRGPLNDTLHELANDHFLRQQLKIDSDLSSAYRKMLDIEFVLRFLTLTETWGEFSGDLALSMDEFMARNQNASREKISDLSQSFHSAIDACESIWAEHAFHRPDGDGWRDQALAGLYDAEMIAVSLLSDDEVAALSDRANEAVMVTRALFQEPEFDKSVRTGTNTPGRIRYRIENLLEALKKLLSEAE